MWLTMRRRNKPRGIAMTEMVFVVPVMILMWMGIDFFRSGYARRLATLQHASTKAWKLASSNDGSCFKQNEQFAGTSGQNDATSSENSGSVGSDATNTYNEK